MHCGPCFHFCQLFYLMAFKFCEMERSSVVPLLQLEAARATWGCQERALGHHEAARYQEWSGLSKKGIFNIDDMISPFHTLLWQLCTNFDRKQLFFRIHTVPKTLWYQSYWIEDEKFHMTLICFNNYYLISPFQENKNHACNDIYTVCRTKNWCPAKTYRHSCYLNSFKVEN